MPKNAANMVTMWKLSLDDVTKQLGIKARDGKKVDNKGPLVKLKPQPYSPRPQQAKESPLAERENRKALSAIRSTINEGDLNSIIVLKDGRVGAVVNKDPKGMMVVYVADLSGKTHTQYMLNSNTTEDNPVQITHVFNKENAPDLFYWLFGNEPPRTGDIYARLRGSPISLKEQVQKEVVRVNKAVRAIAPEVETKPAAPSPAPEEQATAPKSQDNQSEKATDVLTETITITRLKECSVPFGRFILNVKPVGIDEVRLGIVAPNPAVSPYSRKQVTIWTPATCHDDLSQMISTLQKIRDAL